MHFEIIEIHARCAKDAREERIDGDTKDTIILAAGCFSRARDIRKARLAGDADLRRRLPSSFLFRVLLYAGGLLFHGDDAAHASARRRISPCESATRMSARLKQRTLEIDAYAGRGLT